MDRRDISKVLLGSVAGSTLLSERASAQACVAPCYPRTAAEIAAGVTPTLTNYLPGDVRRYGAVPDHTTDCAAAIQAAVNQAQQNGASVYLPADHGAALAGFGYRISAPISISSGMKIYGDGYARTAIRASCNVFNIAAGVTQVEISDLCIKAETRYSDASNTFKAINIQGTTASHCDYHTYRDLFIDGFETPIQADAVHETTFNNITTVFGKHGIQSEQLSANVWVHNCHFSGSSGAAGSYGLRIGDGASAAEGWIVTDNLINDFDTGIFVFGSNNHRFANNIVDSIRSYGIILQSNGTAAATNCDILHNYFALSGSAGLVGIRCLNNVVPGDPAYQRGNIISGNEILYYPFGGAAVSYGIRVDGTQEKFNTIHANTVKASVYDCYINSGTSHIVTSNQWRGPGFATDVPVTYESNNGVVIGGVAPTVASAAAVTLPAGPKTFYISGTTNITSISASFQNDRTVRLIFASVLTLTDGGNLKLNGNFVTSVDDTITLYCDGTNWIELGRSPN